jgi:thiosulfate/3-mercaptopyruvate sulfurtransferase
MSDIELEELSSRLGAVRIVDVRAAHEYDGTRGAQCDPRQGHIPGALNLDVDDLLLLTADEVGDRLDLTRGQEVVVYCHSGSRSAFAAQVLHRLGYEARNYRGSWHEWSRTELPVEP